MKAALFRSLTHRNFRLFFGGQGVSLIGTFMQQMAMAWVVFELKHSAFWLGVVGFCGQIPTFFLAPLAGVLVDRWDRYRLLLLTQTLQMVQAFVLAFLALTKTIEIWHVLALSLFLGSVNAFDITVRQAFLTQMVERREDLANAVALNSSMVNGARLVGPALAGYVLYWTSAGVCFLANGISFLAVLAALLAMHVPPHAASTGQTRLVRGLGEGFRYAFGFAPIRSLLLLLALISMTGMSYSILLPIFATDVLHGNEATLGLLSAASGLGALLGAVYLAGRMTVVGLGRWIALTPALLGLGLIGFAFATVWWLALPCLMVAGFAMMVQMAASNTVLQTIVDEDKRGRVMSFYTMAFIGVAPLGSLLAGVLAERDVLGASGVVLLSGVCCIVGSVLFSFQLPYLRTLIRPIYIRMGILPEMAAGIQAASEWTVAPGRR